MSFELFSASPAILNYSLVNYSIRGKLRRLWRLAVATQPTIAEAAPLRYSYSLQLKGCHKQHLIAIYVFFVEEAIDARFVWQNIGKKMGSNGAALTVA